MHSSIALPSIGMAVYIQRAVLRYVSQHGLAAVLQLLDAFFQALRTGRTPEAARCNDRWRTVQQFW